MKRIRCHWQRLGVKTLAIGGMALVLLWPQSHNGATAKDHQACGVDFAIEESQTGAAFLTECNTRESTRSEDQQCSKAFSIAQAECTERCFDEPICGARKDFVLESTTRSCQQGDIGGSPLAVAVCALKARCSCGRP
jgi:hypothetical protein